MTDKDQKIESLKAQMKKIYDADRDYETTLADCSEDDKNTYYNLKRELTALLSAPPAIDIRNGEVVAEMHGHQTNYGKLKGWSVRDRFEIDRPVYDAIIAALPSPEGYTPKAVGNKHARVLSSTDDIDGVMVIYEYDGTYHIATLIKP